MKVYLTIMSVLFATSAGVLLLAALGQAARRQGRKAAIYLGLTLLACAVAAGFLFFRQAL
jgi:high-affinity Fe2+/Pb2+ permease